MTKLGPRRYDPKKARRQGWDGRQITNIRPARSGRDNRGCALVVIGLLGAVATGVAAIKGWA
jgi:hypothetical protein